MRNRWVILAILFTVRLTMAFQFQSVAAVAPLLGKQFGVGIAEIGFLIGLYFTPGIALSLPGGAIGHKFGDKATVLGALALMLVGSLAMAFGETWHWQIAGRLVGGAGGVLLNVQLTKMVTDWFAGKEIATAMGAFVNSWPAGMALSLVTLPSIGTGLWREDSVPGRLRADCRSARCSPSPTGRPRRHSGGRRHPPLASTRARRWR